MRSLYDLRDKVTHLVVGFSNTKLYTIYLFSRELLYRHKCQRKLEPCNYLHETIILAIFILNMDRVCVHSMNATNTLNNFNRFGERLKMDVGN